MLPSPKLGKGAHLVFPLLLSFQVHTKHIMYFRLNFDYIFDLLTRAQIF
jgi:hypothetical protein